MNSEIINSDPTNNEVYNNEFYANRMQQIIKLKSEGINPYPHSFSETMSFKQFIDKYSNIEAAIHMQDTVEHLSGRIMEIRDTSKLVFLSVVSDGHKLQFMVNLQYYENNQDETDKLLNFKTHMKSFNRGDICGAIGFVGKSKKGELSLFPTKLILLTPCLHVIPKQCYGLKDEELRIRKRYLDLLINPESRQRFIIRNKVIKYIRNFLDNKEFIEVQTPILTPQAGGAAAKPFKTYHNDHNMEMSLRIAPELYLKQLIVGGFNRVYEIGPQFRNESRTYKHNPEFWSLEYYQANADYTDLMTDCEELLSKMVLEICGSYKIKYLSHNSTEPIEIDFTPPFKRVDMISTIETAIGEQIPIPYDSEQTRLFLKNICLTHNIFCSEPQTVSRLLDKLAGHYIEDTCVNPTFLLNHPAIMSPLAKWNRTNSQLTERFELFVNRFELCNAYTELNDPIVQRTTFENQMKDKANGDEEAQMIDETFINALEFGLPPTGGFGLGIDRLVMLLSNSNDISNVIYFPTLKPN
jgi:lysyl-tRNA synthetase class 2